MNPMNKESSLSRLEKCFSMETREHTPVRGEVTDKVFDTYQECYRAIRRTDSTGYLVANRILADKGLPPIKDLWGYDS